uniref:transmembrane protein 132B-like n=1 Tax=Pristiophorus japonicus TaxID=55135 RepID=UPI00398E4A24
MSRGQPGSGSRTTILRALVIWAAALQHAGKAAYPDIMTTKPPSSPLYLPVDFEVLGTQEYLFLRPVDESPTWNSSGPRTCSQAILLLGVGSPPEVKASHRPFSVQQPLPEAPSLHPGWRVRAHLVEGIVRASWPRAQVLFHLSGRDWRSPGDPGILPCIRLHAFLEDREVRGDCRLKGQDEEGREGRVHSDQRPGAVAGHTAAHAGVQAPDRHRHLHQDRSIGRPEAQEVLNTAVLTGRLVAVPIKAVTVEGSGSVTDVTEMVDCASEDEDVVKVSKGCDYVYFDGTETGGRQRIRVDLSYQHVRAALHLSAWAPQLPLQIELSDSRLSQVKGWRVPVPSEKGQAGDAEEAVEDEEEGERKGRGCPLQYQRATLRVHTQFVAGSPSGRQLASLLGAGWRVDVGELVAPWVRVGDPRVARVAEGSVLVGLQPGVTSVQVLSPVSESVIGRRAVTVAEDKVAIAELGVQLVAGIALSLRPADGGHGRVVVVTATAQEALHRPKQEAALSLWLRYSDGTWAPLWLYQPADFALTVVSLDERVVSVRGGEVVAEGEGSGYLLRAELAILGQCRKPRRKSGPVLASAEGRAEVLFGREERTFPHRERPDSRLFDAEAEAAGTRGPSPGAGGEELSLTTRRVTELEMGLYALLVVFCLAIAVFFVNCLTFVLGYRGKEPPDPQPGRTLRWVWAGTEGEAPGRQSQTSAQRGERASNGGSLGRGTLDRTNGGTLDRTNGGTLGCTNGGTLTIAKGGTLGCTNGGTLTIAKGGTLDRTNGGTLDRTNGGTLGCTNGGTLTIAKGGTLDRTNGGTLDHTNGGTLGCTNGGTLTIAKGGTLDRTNGGTLDHTNGGTLGCTNGGTLTIAKGGTLDHTNGGTLDHTNGGTLGHTNGGTLTIAKGGTLDHTNGGTLDHTNGGTLGIANGGTLGHTKGGTLGRTNGGSSGRTNGTSSPAIPMRLLGIGGDDWVSQLDPQGFTYGLSWQGFSDGVSRPTPQGFSDGVSRPNPRGSIGGYCRVEGGSPGGPGPDLRSGGTPGDPRPRRGRQFSTVAAAAPDTGAEGGADSPATQSIVVADEEGIRWVCQDMGLQDPDQLRRYMERIRERSA